MRWVAFSFVTWLLLVNSSSGQQATPFRPVNGSEANLPPVRIRLNIFPAPAVTNDPPLISRRGSLHVTFWLLQEGSYFGSSISRAGDVNGDGFPDVLVSASRFTANRKVRAGAAMVLSGSATGLQGIASWRFEGYQSNLQFGRAIAGGGDVNGDGLPDLVIGALRRFDSGNNGLLTVFYGNRTAINPDPDWEHLPPENGTGFASSLLMAGDVNRDGYDDVIVGATRLTRNRMEEGAVFLFSGSRAGLLGEPVWSAFGGATNTYFGDRLATGDVNGDGFLDLLVGAPTHSVDGVKRGRVLLFLGGPAGFSKTPAWTADGAASDSYFGGAIAVMGDINGDGCSDFLVGMPYRTTGPDVGKAFLYLGARSGMSTTPVWTALGRAPGARFGSAIASVGDVNGDGFGDVLIGSPELRIADGGEGRASLFLGTRDGLDSAPSWVVDGMQAFYAGTIVAALGDLNQDGFADFALGCPTRNRIDIFYGAATGYNRGDVFPTDGGNSVTVRPPAPSVSITNAVSSTNNVAKQLHRERSGTTAIFAAVLAALAFVGIVVIMRKRQRAAANAERSRIARDLHDDLGARLTRLSMLMELVNRQSATSPEARKTAGLVATTAQEILGSMEQVLWSENPQSDTLEGLATFIVQYAGPFFAPTSIRCRCDVPTQLPNRKVAPEARRNIFLAVKEALNNAAKHSQASEVHVQIRFEEPLLTIIIEDDGDGFPDSATPGSQGTESISSSRRGNGLGNMRERMTQLRGSFEITAKTEKGTRVTLKARL